ncbi:MAG: hypothetical protein LBT95_07695 [Treponema sp.]|jgi:hypothetical protein|nr:hypothetical protein [Treponema sp.]
MTKKYPQRLLFVFLALLLCACPNLNDDTAQKPGKEQGEGEQPEEGKEQENFIETDVGTSERFWTINLATGQQSQISAVLLAETESCLVYAECDAKGKPKNNVDQNTARNVAGNYTKNIYPKMNEAFGEIVHITPKGKVTLLLLDIKDGLNPETEGFVAGYFDTQDMENGGLSNKRDMLYIDTNPGLLDMEGLYSTVAHELQHLINYSNRVLGGKGELDLWINEGLSTAAEYIYGGDPANRVALYNLDLGKTIQFGNNFFVWYGYWEVKYGDSLADYSTAYLFFQWLRIHASNGIGIYKEILNSSYTDFQAVTERVRERIPALKLKGSKNQDWETLLRTWMLANAYQSPSGLYGYQDKIGEMTGGTPAKLETVYLTKTNGQKVDFYPGEGIFSQMDVSSYTPPDGSGPYIRYVGFDTTSTDTIDTGSPSYEGNFLLTFNANPDNTATYPSGYVLLPGESGYLASASGALSGRELFGGQRSVRGVPKLPAKPRPVDARSLIERRKWENAGQFPAGGTAPFGE